MPHPPLIIPDVGHGEEKQIQATVDACREIAKMVAELKPETIILISPHSIMYADYFHISPGKSASGSFAQFGAPQVAMKADYDTEFVSELSDLAYSDHFPAGTLGERDKSLDHGTMIPLYFINQQYTNYKLVRIGLSGLTPNEHYQLGKYIAEVARKLNRRVVVIASGDLSHKLKDDGPYGFSPDGPIFDKEVTEAIASGNFMRFLTFDEDFCESAAECGLRSLRIMSGVFDGEAVDSHLLSYEGPFGVGYSVGSFIPTKEDSSRHFDIQFAEYEKNMLNAIRSEEDAYVRLARFTVETFVRTGRAETLDSYLNTLPDGQSLPETMLTQSAGVFVSLKKNGNLRGCIGTISPTTDCIAREILRNGISACSEDPRFDPVVEDELPKLVYSVDVLNAPESIPDKSYLDVKRYGVIVTSGHKRGLLLPNLEGVNTIDEQIEIALQKGGIKPSERYTLQRFEVVRHK